MENNAPRIRVPVCGFKCLLMSCFCNLRLQCWFFYLQYKKAGADGLMGAMPANEQGEGPLRYSDKLSPAVNHFLIEASRQDVRVCRSLPDLPRSLDTKRSNKQQSSTVLIQTERCITLTYTYRGSFDLPLKGCFKKPESKLCRPCGSSLPGTFMLVFFLFSQAWCSCQVHMFGAIKLINVVVAACKSVPWCSMDATVESRCWLILEESKPSIEQLHQSWSATLVTGGIGTSTISRKGGRQGTS
jgi:hypothetical protein